MQHWYKKSFFAKHINNGTCIYFSEVKYKINKGIVIKYILLTLNWIQDLRYLFFCNILVSVESLLQERELCCYMTILTLYFFFFPQDYDKMLMDLSDLQRADRERRLNIVANIPVSFICQLCYLITYFRLVHWNLSYFLKYCQKIDPIIIMNYQFFLN